VSWDYCGRHFDHVIKDDIIYGMPNSPDRFPDVGNDASEDPEDAPPIVRVPLTRKFIATQPEVRASTVTRYRDDLRAGACFPPVAALKCKGGYLVWNGHHRFSAHRAAGRKTIKLRIWATIDLTVEELVREAGYDA
jgi:hypothetical protein